MSKAWKHLDLGGGGLQQANLQLARSMRRRPVAYAWLLLFPLGAHRWYLREPIGAAAYPALSALAAFWWPAAIAMPAFAAFDLWWIDRRVTALNKRIRMQAFLRDAPGPPEGFAERFAKDDPR